MAADICDRQFLAGEELQHFSPGGIGNGLEHIMFCGGCH
ncbi:hypothetical protein B4089_1279 [Bacillus licheniformis]|nr:hypothetical protein B4089_1279 [Bacillus licheniformis]